MSSDMVGLPPVVFLAITVCGDRGDEVGEDHAVR
jgi:hypothetical protein